MLGTAWTKPQTPALASLPWLWKIPDEPPNVTLKKRERAVVSMLALFSTGHQILTSDKFTMVMFIRGTTVILQVQNRTINGITYWNIYGNFIICT